MTEKQAWAYVAQEFRGATEDQWGAVRGKEHYSLGMCHVIRKLYDMEGISHNILTRMQSKIQQELRKRGRWSFLYPTTKYGARMRVKFAMRYAK